MDVKGKRIYVGLSGGVDSAVSAALLRDAGADVTGVFIKGWYPPGMPCAWAEERRDAMRVAAHLKIQFRTLDASVEYERGVIDYLIREYRAGRTPNPDVMCNREVKFGAFYRYAKAHGADAIATGHYRSGEKDQSYFLWAVPKDVLESTVFPVGHMRKEDVRALAKRLRLPVAEKKDSQGVCFLGDVSVEDFLIANFGETPGQAVAENGEVVGTHNGVLLHTIGERIALVDAASGPWYVQAKDVERNRLIVAKERAGTPKSGARIAFTDAYWQDNAARAIEAQYRYRGPRIQGTVADSCFIPAESLPEPVAAGQSIVFYADGKLLGGAIIA